MKIPRHEVAAVLAKQTLAAGFKESEFSRSVAAYLLEAGRTGELDSLLRDVMQYRADHGIVEVIAASAHELSDAVQADIRAEVRKRQPQAKQIIISPRIDADVVGGVRLEFPNEQLDLSVQGKLNRFKQLTTA